MTSPEKVNAALDRAESIADDPEATQQQRIMSGFLALARPQLEAMLPGDPAELDQLLEQGAEWFRGLCSDPEPAPAA